MCTVSLCVQNVFVYYVLFSQEEGVRVLGRDVKTYVIHGDLKVCDWCVCSDKHQKNASSNISKILDEVGKK